MRENWEQWENQHLAPEAAKSTASRGRIVSEPPCPIRTVYQRDRDRIIHSKAFRRLKHKTQVFVSPKGDHFRTRLTHTLEVAQIARTAARALRLNEDLTEAIALGHDLGHTPFGHAGERSLALLCPGFSHNKQSLRLVDYLEQEGLGLNLSWEVRDGILYHSGDDGFPATLEGRIVRLCDRIAYVNHDIDDAVRLGLLDPGDLPREAAARLGPSHSRRINTLVADLIKSSSLAAGIISLSTPAALAMQQLREYLFEKVYFRPEAKEEEAKLLVMIRALWDHYLARPTTLPQEYQGYDQKLAVCDYIAGMSDNFAFEQFALIQKQ
ncbi:MAG: deoxyguanosinetriphosphate triphosphohydrolase [Clostridiales bacterium]|jgi:dGTPase|nr:deoxyguanosinetriphosphate triphosphohydrolase [Clostridiales bacterium]MDR2713518.1 deoxyguanosinetriphosphate triphosphohydrolase [Clostridiales bacterium]